MSSPRAITVSRYPATNINTSYIKTAMPSYRSTTGTRVTISIVGFATGLGEISGATSATDLGGSVTDLPKGGAVTKWASLFQVTPVSSTTAIWAIRCTYLVPAWDPALAICFLAGHKLPPDDMWRYSAQVLLFRSSHRAHQRAAYKECRGKGLHVVFASSNHRRMMG
jgi:hypothetical protein